MDAERDVVARDGRRHFHAACPRTTVAIAEAVPGPWRVRREQDHRRGDGLLAAPVAHEGRELEAAESRERVRHSAGVLDVALRLGPDTYIAAVARLDALAAARVAELRRPGQVVLRPARHGFVARLVDVERTRA
jgi:hypothetical protein